MKRSHRHVVLHYAVIAALWQDKNPASLGSQITRTSNHTLQLLGLSHFHATLHNQSCPGFTIQALWQKQQLATFSMQSLFPYAVNTACVLMLGRAVQPAMIYQLLSVHCASQLLLQTPLCDMTCQAKPAVLCCGRHLGCHVVPFHPYFVVKPVLLGSTGNGTIWLCNLLCITCTCMQYKSFLEQKEHEM